LHSANDDTIDDAIDYDIDDTIDNVIDNVMHNTNTENINDAYRKYLCQKTPEELKSIGYFIKFEQNLLVVEKYYQMLYIENTFERYLNDHILQYISSLKGEDTRDNIKKTGYMSEQLLLTHVVALSTVFYRIQNILHSDKWKAKHPNDDDMSLSQAHLLYCRYYKQYFCCDSHMNCPKLLTLERYCIDFRIMILTSKSFIKKFVQTFVSLNVSDEPIIEVNDSNE
jgi:hypothetical protein